ncbi:single-stranded-DNA-specific exonuclease RecJ [Filomicrobium sp.]|uniref:single-stranded-DNA-specific exonuclease RecJ n=1 Tax=Filomicrobium sp. TaxID=2024831 RepID=UPI0025841BAE|nr:single-stranded-DNA-specific exonuclease RecJ [Filomicrobium sp.]MCV0371123.1 single-stranded-DNA-specific exonuclease RecJ [Filomicrobium sp.]
MGIASKRAILADAGESEAFLGVTASARGFTWRERLTGQGHALAAAISQRHGLPDLLGRVLAARGVALDDVETFLDPSLKALMPDPSVLRDMDRTAARIAEAIVKGERVAIFGDYDVDGACSSALMARYFKSHGLSARIYIPDRLFEGYGPNVQAIEGLIKDGAQLIVTVDCGTTSFEPLAHATKLGADVLVIDHHQSDETLPDVVAVVNPNRQDDVCGQGHLCAAGVVFLVLVAVTRELRRRGHYAQGTAEPALLELLDLVALATVCDVVPLVGLNRAYVTKGLQVMRQRRNLGLRALFDAAGLDQAPTPYHLGYILGPRINAGGRIGDSALGARLLSLDDGAEAQRIAETLDRLNRERKAIETETLQEAMAEAERCVEEQPDLPVIVLGAENWHKGIVGLVASRLTERFHRPSCVISWTRDGGDGAVTGTGSLRSVAGVDIGRAVRAATASGLLLKGGGHAMAAGLTVAQDNLEALRTFFMDELAKGAKQARETAGLDHDGALTPQSANDQILALIERAGPYGQGNPQPRFAFPAHRVKFAKVVGDAHVRAIIEAGDGSRLDCIAFRAVGQPLGDLLLEANGGFPIHVSGHLRRDTWGGRNRIELMIEDAADPRKQS